jgi:hypothetical protein
MQTSPVVRDRFLADHRRLEAMIIPLIEAMGADDRDEMRRLWRMLEGGLNAHFEAEEKYAIPLLMALRPRDGQALIAEHKHLRRRLAELGTDVDLGTIRLESVRGFVDELQAHARHEDALLYKWCDDHLEGPDRTLLLKALIETVRNRVNRTVLT